MQLDKKNRGGRLRLILWRGVGQAFVASDVDSRHALDLLTDAIADGQA
ncbi:MAG: hypothetical protein JSS41_04600, partial [Proteobacteria bacterium]|nr:hypothetical protein [Pseudomonadota bacterium]